MTDAILKELDEQIAEALKYFCSDCGTEKITQTICSCGGSWQRESGICYRSLKALRVAVVGLWVLRHGNGSVPSDTFNEIAKILGVKEGAK